MAKLTRPKADVAPYKTEKMVTLLSVFSWMDPRPRPRTLTFSAGNSMETTLAQGTSLSDLPSEMLQHIAYFLPISAAASLALSNKKICRDIGTQYWQILKDSGHGKCEDEKFQFLSLLDRDYSRYLVCYRCNTLHPRDPSDLPPTRYKRSNRHEARACETEDGNVLLNDFLIKIDYRHLQLAMKIYRNAAHFGPISEALSHRFTDNALGTSPVLTSQRALVTGEELLVEQQYLSKQDHASDILRNLQHSMIHVCGHLLSARHEPFSELLACKLSHPDEEACPVCSDSSLTHCRYCPTDFDVRVCSINTETTVVVKVWSNLGAFRTPLNPKWLAQRNIPSGPCPVDWLRPFDFEVGSVRRAFKTQSLRTGSGCKRGWGVLRDYFSAFLGAVRGEF